MAINTAELMSMEEKKPVYTADLLVMEKAEPPVDLRPEPVPFDIDKYVAETPIDSTKLGENPNAGMAGAMSHYLDPYLNVGYSAASALNRGLAVFKTHLDFVHDYLMNLRMPGYEGKKETSKPADWQNKVAQTFEENKDYWAKRAKENGINFFEELLGEAVGGAPTGISEFMLSIPYASILGAAEAEKKGTGEISGALVEGAKRGVLGLMFRTMEPMKQYLRAPVMGGVFAGQAAAEGGDVKDVAKGFGTGALYSLASPGGRYGLNEIRENLSKKMIREQAEIPKVEPTPTLTPEQQSANLKERETLHEEISKQLAAHESEGYDASRIEVNREQIRASLLESAQKQGLDPETAQRELDDFFASVGVVQQKSLNKNVLLDMEKKGELSPNNIIRSTDISYIKEVIANKDNLTTRTDAEGNPIIAATEFMAGLPKESNIPMYGGGGGNHIIMIGDKGMVEGKGNSVREVWINPKTNPNDFGYIYKGQRYDYTGLKQEIAKTETATGEQQKAAAFAPEKGFRREPEQAQPVDEISRRSDLVRFLNEKLDIPIRTGRFHDKALGIFKLKEEVIRTKQANDIEVIAHEIGHGLQKFLYPETAGAKGLKTQPFSEFKDELDPLATKPKTGQEVTPEGFAEFIRLYITNPKDAQVKAPSFYDHFEKELKNKSPETLDILKDASKQYDRWIKQPSLQRVLSQVSVGAKDKRELSWDNVYTAGIDDLYPLQKIVDEMAPKKLAVSEDPYKLARLFRGISGKFEAFVDHSPFKFKTYEDVGKSLKDILKPLRDNLDEFRGYMISKRAIELDKRGIETGVLKEDARKVVNEYDSKYKQAFQDIKDFQDHTLNYLKDSGVIDEKTYQKIKVANEDYIPLFRVFEEKKTGGLGSGLEARNPIKKIKGSWRDIQDPLESIIKNTYLYINAAEKNAVGQSLIKLAEKEGMGKYVEKIPKPTKGTKIKPEELFSKDELTQMEEAGIEPQEFYTIFRPSAFTPKENVISVWEDGKQNLYQVHPDIARVFQALDKENFNLLTHILSKPASWLRAGATLTPEFIGRNPFRDQFSAFVYSKYGFVPGWDLAKGIFSLAKKDQMYWDWKKSGADHSMLVSMDRDYLQDKLGDLLKEYPVTNLIKNPVEALRILSELGEAGTRIGEFKKGIQEEGQTKEGMQASGFAAREVTLDFNRKGAVGKTVNAITAFWNANVQGMDKMVRELKENPGPTLMKVSAAITLPSVLLAIATHDDPRVKEVPAWERDLFWIVPTENHVWRIPKPFELGILFGSVPERITHYIMDQDSHCFDGLLSSVWQGGAPGFIPTAAIPIMENWANKSTFFNRPIVPENRTELLPEYQYSQFTTETAKELGRLLGKLPWMNDLMPTSPAYIENLVRGWTGGLGSYALQIADKGLDIAGIVKKGYEEPASTLSDIPFIKAFHVRYPSANAESIQRFYENYKEINQTLQTAKVLIGKENRPEDAQRLMEAGNMENLKGHYDSLRNIHAVIDAIYINPSITSDEKREFMDILYMQMIAIAKNGNDVLDMIKEQRKGVTQ